MKGLEPIVEEIRERLEELEAERELSLTLSRGLIRQTKRVIHALHRGEPHAGLLQETEAEMLKMGEILAASPRLWHSGAVRDAMAELAEAAILAAVVEDRELPSPEDLGIHAGPWVLGMADAIGELRRRTLELLRKGDSAEAEKTLDVMEEMASALMSFDVPDALLPIRRKQDIARSLLERTRSDITIDVLMRRGR